MRLAVGAPLAALFVAAVLGVTAGVADAGESHQARHATASRVSLDLRSDEPHALGATVTLIATLRPKSAWGEVALYDGSSLMASAANYRIRWTDTPTQLAVGAHHFTVKFTPSPDSGYRPSHASLDYVVTGPTPTPVVTPTARPTGGPLTVLVIRHHHIVTASPSATPVAPTSPRSSTHAAGLPFTGFDAIRLVETAAGLVGLGAFLVTVGRRRRHRARHL